VYEKERRWVAEIQKATRVGRPADPEDANPSPCRLLEEAERRFGIGGPEVSHGARGKLAGAARGQILG